MDGQLGLLHYTGVNVIRLPENRTRLEIIRKRSSHHPTQYIYTKTLHYATCSSAKTDRIMSSSTLSNGLESSTTVSASQHLALSMVLNCRGSPITLFRKKSVTVRMIRGVCMHSIGNHRLLREKYVRQQWTWILLSPVDVMNDLQVLIL